jgi:hypothetical protein
MDQCDGVGACTCVKQYLAHEELVNHRQLHAQASLVPPSPRCVASSPSMPLRVSK